VFSNFDLHGGLLEDNRILFVWTLTSCFQLTPRIFKGIEIIRKLAVGVVNGQTARSAIDDGLGWVRKEKDIMLEHIRYMCPTSRCTRRSIF